MAIKTVAIEANVTLSVWKDTGGLPSYDWDKASSSHNIPIGYSSTTGYHNYGSYEWTFTANWQTGAGIGTVTVTEAYLEFYYRRGDNPLYQPSFEIVNLGGSSAYGQGSAQNAWDLIDGIATAAVATVTSARGDTKNLIRVAIDDLSNIQTAINTPGSYYLGIRRQDTTRDTLVELGGSALITGIGTGWSAAAADEVQGWPKLVVTFTETDASHVQHELRYTTSDPTSVQSTPANSLGGYFASNEVFTTAQIGDFVSSSQTTIEIDSGSSLPSAVGIAQVGPEIISFTGIDSDNRQLTGVTRGVAPENASFPSEVDQFLEYIRYLVVDDLFDKKPSTELVQYRCVAVVQTSATALNNVQVSLVQNANADVQVDVGIEVPAFDATEGTLQDAITAGAVTFNSASAAVRNHVTGYYDGGHIIIDPTGTAFEAIIESYDDDGVKATFILDSAMPAFAGGETFRINPAPAQTIINERTAPVANSNRFFGFLGDGGSNQIGYLSLRENVGTLNQHDAFYLWVKRTLTRNQKSTFNTGAIVVIEGTQ
jgi:hypothetical protein